MFDFNKYFEADSIDQALECLNKYPDTMVIAGGTDILVKIRDGEHAGSDLISINGIDELKEVTIDQEGDIHIGPLVSFTQLEENEIIQKNIDYLGKAGGTMGGPQIRNVATIGGNICNGATSADSAPMLLCLNAQLVLRSLNEKRVVPLNEFYLGPGRVALSSDELLVDIIIKNCDYENYIGKYVKFSQRNAMDISTLGCAVMVKEKFGSIEDLRLAYGVAAPTPIRCHNAENYAKGLIINEENVAKIARKALEDVNPRDSWRGSKEFREQLIKVLASRTILEITGVGGK